MPPLTRRRFLQTAAVATAATQLPLHAAEPRAQQPWPENGTLLPDEGWRLSIDDQAPWQQDDLFLPDEVTRAADGTLLGRGQPLPIHPPTGGWSTLTPTTGKQVTLPTTVEQHFWGHYGAGPNGKPRPYTPDEYRYAATTPPVAPADDTVPQNGAYFGVSWWHRPIDIPALMQGKRIFLHIRGARLRAEVFLNQQLVGYSIMEELPFECDLTHAAKPGEENHLAIRLTNPFGRFDWVDGANAKWGHLALYRSHGFGGLDRGMTISAHEGDIRIKDVWVLNQEEKTVYVRAEFNGTSTDGALIDVLELQVIDPISGKAICTNNVNMNSGDANCCDTQLAPKTGKLDVYPTSGGEFPITCVSAESWTLNHPRLYHLRMTIRSNHGHTDTRTIPFGFRTFAPTGLGTNAIFRLNGRRIRLYSAISWGFWGLNGLFPVPELAEKEVTQAKALGLNCLNFHRNLAKEDVLRAHDRLGVLRYLEPGAGKLAIGKLPAHIEPNANSVVMVKPTTEAELFAQRFMFHKCVAMVRAFRSHPSVIEYCLQNEIGADLHNPDTLAILAAMRAEDPSRCIVLNDGFVAPPRKAAQAWYEPWNDHLHRSDEEPWGAWWNQHQGAGDQWYDHFYKSPTDFTYQAPYKNVITEFGEMEGCARPDNHALMVHQITTTYKKYGGTSYDLQDHQEILNAYEAFLTKWNFRHAFPTAESVFTACARTEYESWQNYLENARLSDSLDFAVISGWESTAIENHSGIVDNLRNFKSDPKLISSSLLPVRPIAKQHSMCVGSDDPFVFDLFLANDTGVPVTGELIFSVVDPKKKVTEIGRYPIPPQTPDQFTYLVAENVTHKHQLNKSVPYFDEGGYTFTFALSSHPLSTHSRTIWMTASRLFPTGIRLALSGIAPSLRKQLDKVGGMEITDFIPGQSYDLIITAGLTNTSTAIQSAGETTGLETNPINAVQTTTVPGHIDPAILEAVRAGTPLLCIPQADSLSEGCAQQLAAAGCFTYHGTVGDFRAPWMGNWYFGRQHPIFAGLPTNAALGTFYQVPGRQSNGLLIDRAPNAPAPEILIAYSRDHDRNIGAGTFTTQLGKGRILYHRTPDFHPVLQQRFLANALQWLTT
jgi:hypothetical protein